jgi:hypothetical protein
MPGIITGRSRTVPAPPSVPGIIALSNKRYGSMIPLVFGRAVVSGQIVYQGTPTAGQGQFWNGTAWLIRQLMLGVDIVLVLCEAPVTSVPRCYMQSGTSQVTILNADLSNRNLGGGSTTVITAATATAWAQYVGTSSEGLAHSGTCHVRIHKAALNDDGILPETRWEIQGSACVTGVSTPDAEPAEILLYLLTDPVHGLGFSSSLVNVETGVDGSATSSYRRYTRARGWYLSRAIDNGTSIAQVIEELLAATNSTVIWVDGVLTAVPLDDEASSTGTFWPGHATYPYTPVTSTTAVGDADFADQEEPVTITREPRSRIFSVYPVDYTLRKDDTYAVNHAEYQSDVWSSANNLRRAEALDLTPWVLSELHAWFVAYLTAQRSMYHRSRYTFRAKPKLSLLAPGDFITLTDSIMGISSVSCRVETAEEDEDGVIEITALEWPLGTTKAFSLPTTPPGGRLSAGVGRQAAAYDLSDVPSNVVDQARLTASIYDRDNLWPNPSSEIAPPTGGDTTQPEWSDRYEAGAAPASYSGTWVRRVTSTYGGFWLPCSPGARFYAEAEAKRTSGTNAGGYLGIDFYPTLGSFSGSLGGSTSPAVTSSSWTKTALTSIVAPADTNAVFIRYVAAGGDTCYFDSLYARRVAQPEMIASEVVTETAGTGWTTVGGYTAMRKTSGMVNGTVQYYAGATSAWSSIFTLPLGARPPQQLLVPCIVYDASGPTLFLGLAVIATNGVVSLTAYDDGSVLNPTPFAIGTGDYVAFAFAFAWQ